MSFPEKKTILVVGGTGAQGEAVVKALLNDSPFNSKDATPSPYTIRLLTRDPSHRKISDSFSHLASEIEYVEGSFMDMNVMAQALHGCYGAFVNTDGFTVGEAAEIWAGMRIFELAKAAGVRHYVWSNLDYDLKKGNFDPKYHCEHYDGKGKVAEWMKSFASEGEKMTWSVLTTGPYLQMFFGGLFVPKIQEDSTRVFAVPLGKGHVPIINLDDLGYFARYIFDNPAITSGKDLEVATAMLGWDEFVETFKKVTGLKAVYVDVPYDTWRKGVPFPDDHPVAWQVPNGTTWTDNFRNFWRVWRDDVVTRNMDWIRSIHPNMSTIESWIKETGYDGSRRPLLKGVEDGMKRQKAADIK